MKCNSLQILKLPYLTCKMSLVSTKIDTLQMHTAVHGMTVFIGHIFDR